MTHFTLVNTRKGLISSVIIKWNIRILHLSHVIGVLLWPITGIRAWSVRSCENNSLEWEASSTYIEAGFALLANMGAEVWSGNCTVASQDNQSIELQYCVKKGLLFGGFVLCQKSVGVCIEWENFTSETGISGGLLQEEFKIKSHQPFTDWCVVWYGIHISEGF